MTVMTYGHPLFMDRDRPRPLYASAGVYVVQFPDRVKVGHAATVVTRVGQHRANGATRAVGFQTRYRHGVERETLWTLQRVADQVGMSESFTDISFVEAEAILAAITRRFNGGWPDLLVAWSAS